MSNERDKSKGYSGNRGYKGRNKGRNQNSRSRDAKTCDTEDSRQGDRNSIRPTNDPSWYNKYPQLTTDVGSLWFSNPLGVQVPRIQDDATLSIDTRLGSIPGYMIIKTIAGPGTSLDGNSPLNSTSRAIYSYVRHANSGHANYDAPDITMYLLTIDAYFTMWAKMVRAYGIARLFTPSSRYQADSMLKALGFDPVDFLRNLSQVRTAINNFATKISRYATPGTMDYFKRHTEIYSRLYSDSLASAKSQTYILDPAGYYVYGEASSEGGKLTYTEYPNTLMTLTSIESAFATFDTVIQSEDMNIISGDILKAFGIDGIFTVPFIQEEYVTPIVFDPLMLSQIENATIVGSTFNADSLNISQDPSTSQVIYLPTIMGKANHYPIPTLNMHVPSPTVDDIMEATRFMVQFGDYDSLLEGTTIRACGADIVISARVFMFDTGGVYKNFGVSGVLDINSTISGEQILWEMTNVSLITAFAYAPRITVWYGDRMMGDYFDYDNYTTLSTVTLWNLHNTALLSLFAVPHIALAK